MVGSRLFADCPGADFAGDGSIFRVDALAKVFGGGPTHFRIEAKQAAKFLGRVGGFSGPGAVCPAARMGQPLRFREIGFAAPQRLVRALVVADVLDRCHEAGRTSRIILGRNARYGRVELRPILANQAGFQVRECLTPIQLLRERARLALLVLEYGSRASGDLIRFPPQDVLECPVATLYGLILSEQGNADRRRIQNGLQFGGGPAQLDRPFRHLRLELAASAAQVLVCQRALERAGGVIRGH